MCILKENEKKKTINNQEHLQAGEYQFLFLSFLLLTNNNEIKQKYCNGI